MVLLIVTGAGLAFVMVNRNSRLAYYSSAGSVVEIRIVYWGGPPEIVSHPGYCPAVVPANRPGYEAWPLTKTTSS